MRSVKIVVVGAASASFGPKTLADVLACGELGGSELWLVDLDQAALDLMWRLAQHLNAEWDSGLRIERTTDLAAALPGADYVVSMVEVNRDRLWQLDLTIPHKYGVFQVLGENGGPGGLSHTLRSAPLVLEIARQMEQHCPRAWLLNYTNPVPRVCRAVARYTSIQAVGLCHGINSTIRRAAEILGVSPDEIDVKAAGLNHFHWVLDLRFKATGEDAYPLLRERERAYKPEERRLWRDLLRRYGYLAYPSDDHIAEYLPFMHVAAFGPWEKYSHDHWLLHWDGQQDQRDAQWQRIRDMIAGQAPIEPLRAGSGERGVPVLVAMRDNLNQLELALNIPNHGAITNLPQECIVEVPALVSAYGVQALPMGDLPTPLAGLCSLQAAIAELAVEAAVTGSRQAALQALLIDPVINDVDVAERILDEYLAVHADYLPQFQHP
ncbi:MAG: alpha-glucosidase/alpha-galactosidase [Anaerolineales bacterium]|nr:alpha-glucosidase/alpha-galactosidase [Anaerolineales bacterium]